MMTEEFASKEQKRISLYGIIGISAMFLLETFYCLLNQTFGGIVFGLVVCSPLFIFCLKSYRTKLVLDYKNFQVIITSIFRKHYFDIDDVDCFLMGSGGYGGQMGFIITNNHRRHAVWAVQDNNVAMKILNNGSSTMSEEINLKLQSMKRLKLNHK